MGLIMGGVPFRRSDALAAGWSDADWRAMRRLGEVREILDRVYVDARAPDDSDLRVRAVALVVPPDGVLSRASAAWVLGVDVREPGEHLAPVRLECAVPVGVTPPRRPGVTAYVQDLCGEDVVEVGAGVRVTSPLRTGLDLARGRDKGTGLAALDAFVRAGLTTQEELAAAVERFAGGRGVVQARELVQIVDPGAESGGESRARMRLHDAGFPPFETQVEIRDGGRVVRLDLGVRKARAGVEYDGEVFHGPEHQAHDTARREWIERRGWRLVVARRGDVLGRSMAFELAVGEMLGLEPRQRRRTW